MALDYIIKISSSEKNSENDITVKFFPLAAENHNNNLLAQKERKITLGKCEINVEDLKLLFENYIDGIILFQYEESD